MGDESLRSSESLFLETQEFHTHTPTPTHTHTHTHACAHTHSHVHNTHTHTCTHTRTCTTHTRSHVHNTHTLTRAQHTHTTERKCLRLGNNQLSTHCCRACSRICCACLYTPFMWSSSNVFKLRRASEPIRMRDSGGEIDQGVIPFILL